MSIKVSKKVSKKVFTKGVLKSAQKVLQKSGDVRGGEGCPLRGIGTDHVRDRQTDIATLKINWSIQ